MLKRWSRCLARHWLLLVASPARALVLTPGPNLLYLVSRTLCPGPRGRIRRRSPARRRASRSMSLAAALGLSALLAAVPVAYDAVRWAGAAYLAWLAWDVGARRAARGSLPRRAPAARCRRDALSRRRAHEHPQSQGRAVLARALPAVRRSGARQRARPEPRARRDPDRDRASSATCCSCWRQRASRAGSRRVRRWARGRSAGCWPASSPRIAARLALDERAMTPSAAPLPVYAKLVAGRAACGAARSSPARVAARRCRRRRRRSGAT